MAAIAAIAVAEDGDLRFSSLGKQEAGEVKWIETRKESYNYGLGGNHGKLYGFRNRNGKQHNTVHIIIS